MTGTERCAEVFEALRRAGIECLVMGGHAVRFYGIDRNTIDYDLAASARRWEDLEPRVRSAGVVAHGRELVEGPSWRPGDFRRFVIGQLSDGREERLEFWRTNHLLAPFDDLFARRRTGRYGGRDVEFLGLQDLLRSKETEREDDWRDVALLEERADEEALERARQGSVAEALSSIRSRRGFEAAHRNGLYADAHALQQALSLAAHPIALAYAIPFEPKSAWALSSLSVSLVEVLEGPLREVAAATPRHLALVEVVRRLYKRDAIVADRADKSRLRK